MMILSGKRRAFVCAAAVVLYIAAAGAFLLVLPHPLAALQLMVAGAFATALALIAAFLLCALCRVSPGALARTARRSAQSS